MPPAALDPKRDSGPERPRTGKDTNNPAAQPYGTTGDQIANMENECQAQPQADERERPQRIRVPRR